MFILLHLRRRVDGSPVDMVSPTTTYALSGGRSLWEKWCIVSRSSYRPRSCREPSCAHTGRERIQFK